MSGNELNALERKIMQDIHLTLEAPGIRVFDEPELLPERNDFVMSSGIDITPKGRLWVSWFGGGDSEKAYLLLAKSDDNGRTWSAPQFIIKEPTTPNGFCRSVLGGNVWSDPDGRLWLFFDYCLGSFDGRGGVWAAVCENPDDEHPAWSEPCRIWHGLALNKPLVTKTGEWLLGVSLMRRERIFGFPGIGCEWGHYNGNLFHELDHLRMAHVFASVDKGKSWKRKGGVVIGEERDFDEQVIIERRDGSLLKYLRTVYGIAETESRDGGVRWSRPMKSILPHTSSRIFARRLKSGRLLMVKHGSLDQPVTVRSHLTAYVSEDDGRSWKGGLILDERPGVSYPDGTQTADGRIYIVYDYLRINGEILMSVFSEKDILSGRPSADTRLKIPVKQTRAKYK